MKKLLVLIAVGVAVKYFLDSEKGEEIKNYVKDILGDAQDTFNEYFQKASDKLEGAISQADKKMTM